MEAISVVLYVTGHICSVHVQRTNTSGEIGADGYRLGSGRGLRWTAVVQIGTPRRGTGTNGEGLGDAWKWEGGQMYRGRRSFV